MLSDAIVVWRAWALFKDEARVQWGLISCLAVSYGQCLRYVRLPHALTLTQWAQREWKPW